MMKHILFTMLFAAALVTVWIPSGAVYAQAAANSEGCMQAVAELDDFLLSLPNTCTEDEECGGFYLRHDTCAPAVMLPSKLIRDQELLQQLAMHQLAAQTACAKDAANHETCKPKPYMPACQQGVCVNQWVNKQ